MWRLFAGSSLLLPLACFPFDTEQHDVAVVGVENDEGFVPREGTWRIETAAVVRDECRFGWDPDKDLGASFTMAQEDGRWGVHLHGDLFDCLVAQHYLGCDRFLDPITGGETTLTWALDLDGDFSDEEAVDLDYRLTVHCEGPDCGEFEPYFGGSFPCTTQLDYGAVFVQ